MLNHARRRALSWIWLLIFLVMNLMAMSLITNSSAQSAPAAGPESSLLQAAGGRKFSAPEWSEPVWPGSGLLKRFADDQRAIWASPFSLGRSDAIWALPALAGVGAFVASDSWFAKQVPAGVVARSRAFSNYGVFSLAGAAGGMFLMGKITDNDHAAETGFLAGEAALNAAAVDYALKAVFERQRPEQGSGGGHFFAGGASFPSEHAAVSWAIAGVVAHEYPGRMTKVMAYGLATAVTAARVTGKEHFPSDAVVGGALGYFIARQIFERRRDPETSASGWGSAAGNRPARENRRCRHHHHHHRLRCRHLLGHHLVGHLLRTGCRARATLRRLQYRPRAGCIHC